jgi:hypothetical protein
MNCHDPRTVVTTDVKLMPGLEHLPFAELALNRRLGYRALYEEIVLRGPAVPVESRA